MHQGSATAAGTPIPCEFITVQKTLALALNSPSIKYLFICPREPLFHVRDQSVLPHLRAACTHILRLDGVVSLLKNTWFNHLDDIWVSLK